MVDIDTALQVKLSFCLGTWNEPGMSLDVASARIPRLSSPSAATCGSATCCNKLQASSFS